MMQKPRRVWRLSTVALACSSLALVAVAAQVEPPNVATGLVSQPGLVDREGQSGSPNKQVRYDAASMDLDTTTHALHLNDVSIHFGKITVKADRAQATTADFKDARWTFDGNVRINDDTQGHLHSNEAVLEFQDNQLKRATAIGNPVEFDHTRPDSGVVTHGHADEVVYEPGPGTVRLSNAYVADGKSEIKGALIVYSVQK